MIQITKPEKVPEILQTKGAKECGEMCQDYDKGVRKFKFDGDIYGHAEVKQLLYEIQNEKCIYCETKFTHNSPGDIEHFRPKSLYYWLAYDWKNLFLSCEECNRRYKRDKFPLFNPANKNNSHHDFDRTKLENDRRNHLERLKLIYLTRDYMPPTLRDEADAVLERDTSAKGEYSAMVKAALAVGFEF